MFEFFIQKFGHFPIQVQASVSAVNAVVAVWVEHDIEIFVVGDEFVGHFHAVLEMDIVIGLAMYEQVVAFKLVRKIDR